MSRAMKKYLSLRIRALVRECRAWPSDLPHMRDISRATLAELWGVRRAVHVLGGL